MGTNFYIKTKKCKCCGCKPERIHLGKSFGGWTFAFQYNNGKYYKNIKEMKKWLKDKKIENEYGEDVSCADFWKMIKDKQKETNIYAEKYPSKRDFIIDGYSFTNSEFS